MPVVVGDRQLSLRPGGEAFKDDWKTCAHSNSAVYVSELEHPLRARFLCPLNGYDGEVRLYRI